MKPPAVLLRAWPTVLGSTKLVTTLPWFGFTWPLWRPRGVCPRPRGAFHTRRGAEPLAAELRKDVLHRVEEEKKSLRATRRQHISCSFKTQLCMRLESVSSFSFSLPVCFSERSWLVPGPVCPLTYPRATGRSPARWLLPRRSSVLTTAAFLRRRHQPVPGLRLLQRRAAEGE